MIVPTKRISPHRSLLGIGYDVLSLLGEPKTVSRLWSEHKRLRADHSDSTITYDWFVMALDLLFALNTIDLQNGLITKANKATEPDTSLHAAPTEVI